MRRRGHHWACGCRACCRARGRELEAAIQRDLGLVREQLVLALPVSPSAIATGSGVTPCPECERWGYHLAGCSIGRAKNGGAMP